MSDEEKKAIEMLRNYDNEDNLHKIHQSINVLLNLIEKQSKEIEELKEVKWYYEISRVPKDKIKAKIEDILNSENSEAIEKLIEWQSLLEKE